MKAFEFIIDKTGTLIYPSVVDIFTSGVNNPPDYAQITCVFYDTITTSSNGVVTCSDPVLTGLSGTIQLQARSTADSAWSNIQNGTLDISTQNMAFPSGVIQSINAICTGVAGCNYILIRFDRGA